MIGGVGGDEGEWYLELVEGFAACRFFFFGGVFVNPAVPDGVEHFFVPVDFVDVAYGVAAYVLVGVVFEFFEACVLVV